MSKYAEICVNMPKSAWMAFILFPHCNPFSTCEMKLFFMVAESIWFVCLFCFRLFLQDFRLH